MWLPIGIRLKAQKVGEKLLSANPDLIFGLQERNYKRFQFVNRTLIRLDRLCNGKPAFKERVGHRLEICNAYFGLSK